MGRTLVVPVSICNPAGEPIVCERAVVDTGADVSGLPKRLMAPLGLTDSMCFPEDTGNPLMAERVDLPRLGFSINVHCVGRRTLVRPIFSEHAERAWLGLDFLQHWHVEWEGWTGGMALHPHPELPQVSPGRLDIEDALQRNLDALAAG